MLNMSPLSLFTFIYNASIQHAAKREQRSCGAKVCDTLPGLYVSSRHKRRSITGPFLSTTDSTANKQQALLFQTLTPPLHDKHICAVRISSMAQRDLLPNSTSLWPTVVSLYSELPPSMMISPASRRGTWGRSNVIDLTRQDWTFKSYFNSSAHTTHQFINEVVHSLSGLNQQDDPPGLLQLGHHVLQRLCSNHLRALRLILQEVVHLGHSAVVGTDLLDRFSDYWVK